MVWEIHAFTVTDGTAFTAALDAFLGSDTGKEFPGRAHLSAVAAAGMSVLISDFAEFYRLAEFLERNT